MSTRKIRISIAEDEEPIRKTLEAGLRKQSDMEFISAYADIASAVSGLPEDNPDIVLMDIEFKENQLINGISGMMQIQEENPDVRFLMFTVFAESNKVFSALKAGASGYILKKDGIRGVIEGIRELNDNGAPMSKEIARKVLESFHTVRPRLEGLTLKETRILELLAEGLLYKEIGSRFQPPYTEGTIKQYIHRIYQKLQVNNRTEAINKYMNK